METPMNDDSDDGNGGGDGGNTVLNHNNSYRNKMTTFDQKMSFMAHSFVITEPCNICIQL